MTKKILTPVLLAVFLAGCCNGCRSQARADRPAYVVYDGKGRKVGYQDMIKAAAASDVFLFGEQHNDPISHWLELNIAQDLYRLKKEKLVIGAEMWETDNQLVLDEYMEEGRLDLTGYVSNSRMWNNFETDYKPVLEFANENGIRFVATNTPRRYARMVSDGGMGVLDSLKQEAYRYLAPTPVEVDYDGKLYLYIGEIFKHMSGAPMKKSFIRNLVDAQALKDATMAWFITRNLEPEGTFFHFHGELHSAYRAGIAHYIGRYAPGTKIVTVSVHEAEDPLSFKASEADRADFNVVVPANMTKTYAD